MFWRRKLGGEKGKQKKKRRPDFMGVSAVWRYMTNQLGLSSEVLWRLMWVESDGVIGDKPVTMIRIFDPATVGGKGIAIEDYQSLDGHPELILYEGYYREVSGQATDIHIEKK